MKILRQEVVFDVDRHCPRISEDLSCISCRHVNLDCLIRPVQLLNLCTVSLEPVVVGSGEWIDAWSIPVTKKSHYLCLDLVDVIAHIVPEHVGLALYYILVNRDLLLDEILHRPQQRLQER